MKQGKPFQFRHPFGVRKMFGLLFAGTLISFSLTFQASASPTRCAVDTLATWSPQERWVWTQLCTTGGGLLDERYPGSVHEKWPKTRELSSSFIETIFSQQPYLDILASNQPIVISGARFKDSVNLSFIKFPLYIEIDNSRFDSPADFGGLLSDGEVALEHNSFSDLILFESRIHYLILDHDRSSSTPRNLRWIGGRLATAYPGQAAPRVVRGGSTKAASPVRGEVTRMSNLR